jgi:DNA-binding transcriptional regulator YiaG
MPNIATLLKSEISRVARKEIRVELLAVRKAVTAHRAEIAALKRRAETLEREIRRLAKSKPKVPEAAASEDTPNTMRFTAKGLASMRRRLGLSAEKFGRLVGASSQSIYNWEDGAARPRAKNLLAVAALKTLSKKQAFERLQALSEAN